MLERVWHFLQTGVVLPETLFPAGVVCFDPLPKNLTADDRLFYGQYDKANRAMIALLKDLTEGQFKNGAIARILARKFWSSGKAPTFREYATEWLHETENHTGPNPEWAFLSERASRGAIPDWKKLRASKASKAMKVLKQVTAPFSHGSETFRPRPSRDQTRALASEGAVAPLPRSDAQLIQKVEERRANQGVQHTQAEPTWQIERRLLTE